jgi:hypothetical protein
MNKAPLLTKEQAQLLKKKKPAKRTTERYKYVNAAVAQATILGPDKLVFVTMCEFADDAGWLWHGERSLAIATGLSQPTVHRCIERLIARGVVVLLHKGGSKWDSNIYRVVEVNTEEAPTIYTLAKNYSLKKQGKLQPILTESEADETDSDRIGEPGEPILCESKDIEFDFDSSQFSFKTANDGGFAAALVNLEGKEKSQNQSQNQPEVLGSQCVSEETNIQPKTTAEKRETKTNRNTNSKTIPGYVIAPRYIPAPECEVCLQTTDNHHKNCTILRNALHA